MLLTAGRGLQVLGALFLLILVIADLFGATSTALDKTVRQEGLALPGCGEVAVYAMLQTLGNSIQLADVRTRFATLVDGFHPSRASIWDVRRVLESFGIATQATRHRKGGLKSLPTPCILYFRPGPRRSPSVEPTGHFVTLIGFKENEAVVVDWNPLERKSGLTISPQLLSQGWDGEVIELRRSNRWLVIGGLCLSIICGLGLASLKRFRAVHRSQLPAAVMLSVLLFGGGCQKQEIPAVPPPPPLTFREPVLRFNEVSGLQPLKCVFPFEVSNQNPVKITGISRSCSCTTTDASIVGQSLPAGSEHELGFTINVNTPTEEAVVVTMEIMTDPPSATPLVLAVQYKRKEQPVLSVAEVRVESEPNRSCSAELVATYKRKSHSPPLCLNVEQSEGKDIVLATRQCTTEKLPGTESVIDTLPITLGLPGVDWYGESRARVKLVFMDGTEHMLPVTVRAAHPFSPRVANYYCGWLAPSQAWSVSIPFDRRSTVALTVGGLRYADPISTATLGTNDTLLVTGHAPATAGRFSATVHISFLESAIPAIEIPVWGIVESKQTASIRR